MALWNSDDLTGADIMYKTYANALKRNHLQDRVATYKMVQVLSTPFPMDARASATLEGAPQNPAESGATIGKWTFRGRIRDLRAPLQPADPCNLTYVRTKAAETGVSPANFAEALMRAHPLFVTVEGLKPKKFEYVIATLPIVLVGGEEVPLGNGTCILHHPAATLSPSQFPGADACQSLSAIVAEGGVGHAGGPSCPGSGPTPFLDPGPMTAIYNGQYGAGAGTVVENGNFPETLLARVSTEHSDSAIKLLADVVSDFNNLAAAFHAANNEKLSPNGGMRCYSGKRECQVEMKCRKGTGAATPGRSQHGWGLAFDYSTKGGFGGKFYKWMVENGPKYNWVHPCWAKQVAVSSPGCPRGGTNPEAWHMEHMKVNSLITAAKDPGKRPSPASATENAVASNTYPVGTTRTDIDGPGPAAGGEWVLDKNFVWINKAKGEWKEIPV